MGIESTYGLKDRMKANKLSLSIGDSLANKFRNEETEMRNAFEESNKVIYENYNNTRARRNNIVANNQFLMETQNDIFCEAFRNIVEKSIFIECSKKALLEEYIKDRTTELYNAMVSNKYLHSEGTEAYDAYLQPFVACSDKMEDIIKDYDGDQITPEMKKDTVDVLKQCVTDVEENKESETVLVEDLQRRVYNTVKQEKAITANRKSLMESCKGFNGTTLFSSINYYHFRNLKNEEAEVSELNNDETVENKEEIKNEKEPKKCCSEGFESLEEEAFCKTIVDYTILEGFNAFNLCDFKNEDLNSLSKVLYEKTDLKK